MHLEQIKNICVVGAGLMGHGIGAAYALGGYRVVLNDISNEVLRTAMGHIKDDLETFVESSLITRNLVDGTLSRIKTTTDTEKAARDADFVTEAVSEDVEIKRDIFEKLDTICPAHTILASNTSSLVLSDFIGSVKRKDRVLVTHWFNPPHIVPVIEVVQGAYTSDDVFETVCALIRSIEKIPVKIYKEVPGFIVNRIQAAMLREAWSLWQQGVASPGDIDLAVKGSTGFRLAAIGPLMNCDASGLDLWYNIAQRLFKVINDSHEPPEALKERIESGALGLKSGKGIFDYKVSSTDQEQDEVAKLRDKRFIQLLKILYPELQQ